MSRQKGDIMKQVLISIKPQWVELIASGNKTIEVRKTKPKLDVPFKCYIYETQGRTETPFIDEEGHHIFKGRGQVIGEFVCDNILDYTLDPYGHHSYFISDDDFESTCLTFYEQLWDYGKGKTLYGWHITDLVVYNEPRELRDFKPYNRTEEDCKFSHLGLAIPKCKDCRECYVKRPYQSWGYVEATEPRQTAD